MYLGRTVLHRVPHIQYKGILHFDGPNGLGGGSLVFRHHRSDVVAAEAHPLGQHQAVRHVLMALVGGSGVSGSGKVVLFLHVKAG